MEQIKTKKVEVRNLSKIFFQKNSSFEVVKDVSFDVYDGESVRPLRKNSSVKYADRDRDQDKR